MNTILKIAMILVLPYHGLGQKKIAFEPAPVSFTIKNAAFKVNGSMNGLDGFVTLDSQNATLIKIEGSIDPNTINTGISSRDDHLKKPEYFNVKEFPKIFMTSTQINKMSDDNYVGNFDLTIKGIKKTLAIPFVFSSTANGYMLKADFPINRLDFQVGGKSIILGHSVKIKIEFNTSNK